MSVVHIPIDNEEKYKVVGKDVRDIGLGYTKAQTLHAHLPSIANSSNGSSEVPDRIGNARCINREMVANIN